MESKAQDRGRMYMPAAIDVDDENNHFFDQFADDKYKLKYITLVNNQFTNRKLSIYGKIE